MVKYLSAVIVLAVGASAFAIPDLARKFNTSCGTCHTHPPKLNARGYLFVARGPEALGLPDSEVEPSLSVWLSSLTRPVPDEPDKIRTVPNRVELISMGDLSPGVGYFAEWRPLSLEILNDGTIRDRSGRFEDLFVSFGGGSGTVTVGQFRAMEQYDVSGRMSLSEPPVFSSSLPGPAASTSRLTSLRGFSLSGRAPGVRASWQFPDGDGIDGWYTVATVPFAGELSIPLTDEARVNASAELEGTPKGYFFEAYRRDGLTTYGVNYFTGSADRSQVGLVATHALSGFHLLGAMTFPESMPTRWALEAAMVPDWRQAYGLRIDGATGSDPFFVPYVSFYSWDGRDAFRLLLEARVGREARPQFGIEFSWMH